MNERTDEPGCDVVALVPHPYDSALVLCVDPPHEHEGAVPLPGIRTGPEPGIDELVRGLGEHLQSAVIPLRANALTWHENFDAASMIAEIEPVSAQPPEGFCWRHVDESTIDSVSPDWARVSVAAWLLERSRGWSDLRPQWSRPGWLDQAGSWMREQMDLAGFVDPQTPRVHHLWGVSVVLCAESSSGTAYLKCSGERFRHEAIVTRGSCRTLAVALAGLSSLWSLNAAGS